MFSYEKIKTKTFKRKCSECGDERIVTYISKNNDCTGVTCGLNHFAQYINKNFGDIKILNIYKNKTNTYYAKCKCCVCGLEFETRFNNLLNNNFGNQSHSNCKKIIHKNVDNLKKFQNFYERWRMVIRRCSDPSHKSYNIYSLYGVSDEWKDFMFFYFDMYKSFSIELQLDRVDGNKGYSKENCRWVTPKENCLNRSTTKEVYAFNLKENKIYKFGKETETVRAFFKKEFNLSATVVYDRLNGKQSNNTPYKGFMFFNTKKELNDYLSVEAKCK